MSRKRPEAVAARGAAERLAATPRPPESALKDWISSASVRVKPSLTDFDLSGNAGEFSGVQWFVFGHADEFMSHPALRHLDMPQRNAVSAARLAHFLDDMTLTEHRIVNVAAQVIAENRLRAYLPERLAIDALKLYTDEGYHAYFTAQASRAIRDRFALPVHDAPNPKIAALEALVAGVPAPRRDLAWFMVGFVGETMITKAIVDTMRATAHTGLLALLQAHLEDEWQHARYFAQLFGLVWPQLGAADKAFFGALLPTIIQAFHTWDEAFHRHLLAQIGLDSAAIERVLAQEGSETRRTAHMRSRCGNTLQVLERSGVFKQAALRTVFVQHGLLERDSARGGRAARAP
ncbi:diiron oxygenase [Hydrogenophaga palleronii]|uniref:diiron oxygenase n=1 Tax=Hydrogenophaga palleronii TaxID=65655 RepID=UPI0014722AC3|nr:diiron oxygenase [Hydrogenophaga palleronii]